MNRTKAGIEMTNAYRAAAVGLILPAVLAACANDGGDGAAGEWSGTIADSAGVVMVANDGNGAWGPGDGWSFSEALRIGSAAGDTEYQFGQIGGIGIASDGRVIVLDQQAQDLRVYGPDGTYEATIATAGSGPGELGMGASPVMMGPGDTIAVADMGNQRVSLYTADGEPAGSWRIDFADGIPMRWDVRDGNPVSQVRPFATTPDVEPDSMDAIIQRSWDGTPGDTLFRMPSGKTFSTSGGDVSFNFFTAEPQWTIGSGGELIFGVNDRYRIEVYEDGELIRVVTMPHEPEPVTQADQDAFKNVLEEAWSTAGVPPQQVEMLLSRVSFADTYPAYLQFLAGPQGTIWVQHLRPPSTLKPEEMASFNPMSLGASTWDVLDAEGRFLGQVETPERFQPFEILDGRIIGVWRDELDVQYVIILNIDGLGDDAAT
jgi:hypothetical protein